jgi:YidC/Oxa1 family membrane protein insertase
VIAFASILQPLETLLTNILEWLHTTGGLSWAFAIIVLTLMVRMVMVPLTIKQIHSMQRLQVLAPELKALQQKYKTDKKRQQEEVMRFYRENKVNPAASCLPLLLQIPIFISLFYVLRGFEDEVYHLYPASDLSFLWIVPNITDPVNSIWSGWLLLVVYVASQLASALLTPVTDKTQRIIFIVLPFAFVPFILGFPIGLLLYWITTNLWTVGQGIVTRRLMPKPQVPPKRSSRTPAATAPTPAPAVSDGEKAAAPAPKSGGSGERRVRRRKKRGPQTRR